MGLRSATFGTVGGRPQISVVIPAPSEEALIAGAVRSVGADAEVIVVNGGSLDRTVAAAQAAGAGCEPGARAPGCC